MKKNKILFGTVQKRTLYLSTAILWISGALWLWLDPANAARPLWMKLHGAAAMAFLLVFGSVLAQHVPAGWQQNRQRPVGSFLVTLCSILVVTGWGLYYIGNETVRHAGSLVHTVLGLALPLAIAFHIWLSRRQVV